MKLILASGSPRRAEILRAAGYEFCTAAPAVDESRLTGEDPVHLVERLALEKARNVAALISIRAESTVVLGADTVVVCEGEVLGKPHSAEKARVMLRKLSGREHEVVTGVALVRAGDPSRARSRESERAAREATKVWVSKISDAEIDEYIETGEPLDKAGAYAIQGRASRFIPRIEGCYFNVVGLPIALVARMLSEFGVAAVGNS